MIIPSALSALTFSIQSSLYVEKQTLSRLIIAAQKLCRLSGGVRLIGKMPQLFLNFPPISGKILALASDARASVLFIAVLGSSTYP
jgi:hypothetical protein